MGCVPNFPSDRIKALARETGFHACGITIPNADPEAESRMNEWIGQGKHGNMKYLENYSERKQNFWSRFPDAESVIVLGVNYYSAARNSHLGTGSARRQVLFETNAEKPVPARTGTDILAGRVARYAWGKDYHQVIAKRLELLKEKIKQEAGEEVKFDSLVDTKPVLERSYAQKAGLGFIGKQTQLLSLEFGPWLFLAELITNLELEPDQPFVGSCGTCRLCIEACPTSAIESGSIDARKCIAYLTIENKQEIPVELRSKVGNWVFGCDVCLEVCPYTAKEKETDWREFTDKAGVGGEIDLNELIQLKTNKDHEKKFAETAVSRANRKQLLRNSCVVLGNSVNKNALLILNQLGYNQPDLVKLHAEWARARLEDSINPE